MDGFMKWLEGLVTGFISLVQESVAGLLSLFENGWPSGSDMLIGVIQNPAPVAFWGVTGVLLLLSALLIGRAVSRKTDHSNSPEGDVNDEQTDESDGEYENQPYGSHVNQPTSVNKDM